MDVQMLFSIWINHWISVKCGFKVEREVQKTNSAQDIFTFSQLQGSAHTTISSQCVVGMVDRSVIEITPSQTQYCSEQIQLLNWSIWQPEEGRLSHVQGRGIVLKCNTKQFYSAFFRLLFYIVQITCGNIKHILLFL